MAEWFNERYISRREHQEIVDYYRRLVARLHCHVRDLRAQIASGAGGARTDSGHGPDPKHSVHGDAIAGASGGNVVRLDDHRCRRIAPG